MGAKKPSIRVGPLREEELEAASRVMRIAFGTFLGLPNPLDFMGDRDFIAPRWRARNTVVLASRDQGKLIGVNVATRWGSFAFFGPLTVLPEYWNCGVAQKLLAATMKVFDKWGVRQSGLFTFSNSPKHVGLYQRFGYWPGYLTALMRYAPQPRLAIRRKHDGEPILLSALNRSNREMAIRACARLTNRIETGLDLSDEIRVVLAHQIGEAVLVYGRKVLDAFAICMHGPGSEGGAKTCYVKFAAARGGSGGGDRFERLLDAIESIALEREAEVEAGVSLACKAAFRRMRSRGYKAMTLGVAMQKPHSHGFNRPGSYVVSDWR